MTKKTKTERFFQSQIDATDALVRAQEAETPMDKANAFHDAVTYYRWAGLCFPRNSVGRHIHFELAREALRASRTESSRAFHLGYLVRKAEQ